MGLRGMGRCGGHRSATSGGSRCERSGPAGAAHCLVRGAVDVPRLGRDAQPRAGRGLAGEDEVAQRWVAIPGRSSVQVSGSTASDAVAICDPEACGVLRRQYEVFGDARFERLSRLSPSHLYNLRRSKTYRARRTTVEHTRPTTVRIGERRRPDPGGKPGYVRVDTLHQGDRNGVKGVYDINMIDDVTQFEHVGAVTYRRGLPSDCYYRVDGGCLRLGGDASHARACRRVAGDASAPRRSGCGR